MKTQCRFNEIPCVCASAISSSSRCSQSWIPHRRSQRGGKSKPATCGKFNNSSSQEVCRQVIKNNNNNRKIKDCWSWRKVLIINSMFNMIFISPLADSSSCSHQYLVQWQIVKIKKRKTGVVKCVEVLEMYLFCFLFLRSSLPLLTKVLI